MQNFQVSPKIAPKSNKNYLNKRLNSYDDFSDYTKKNNEKKHDQKQLSKKPTFVLEKIEENYEENLKEIRNEEKKIKKLNKIRENKKFKKKSRENSIYSEELPTFNVVNQENVNS